MPWTLDDRSEKAVFVFLNVVLAVIWIRFLVRLIAQWNIMAPSIRDHACVFMAFFSFWWSTLIREKRSVIAVLMAGACFMTVYDMFRLIM